VHWKNAESQPHLLQTVGKLSAKLNADPATWMPQHATLSCTYQTASPYTSHSSY